MHRELEALGGFAQSIPTTLWEWVKSLFVYTNRDCIDEYLSTSTDVFDLEFKIRMLARKGLL